MVPGWTLPGVMTIGAAQTFVRRYGVAPGRRVLIASHGPLGLQLAAELSALDADVIALAERGQPHFGPQGLKAAMAAPRLVAEGLGYRVAALRAGVPVLTGWELVRVFGEDRVEGADLHEIATGRTRHFDVDTVAAGDGFAPQLELARLLGVPIQTDPATGTIRPERATDGRTPVKGVWIAGDAGGLGGAEIALCQGDMSAIGALDHIGRSHAAGLTRTRHHFRRAQHFQSALWHLYAAPPRHPPSLNHCVPLRRGDGSRGSCRDR